MIFLTALTAFLKNPDNLTTIAGLLPIVLNLAQAFGFELDPGQRSAVMEASVAVIGFFTAKSVLQKKD